MPNTGLVKQTLKTSIVPPLIYGTKLSTQGFYFLYVIYSYLSDISAGLVGAGLISSGVVQGVLNEKNTGNFFESSNWFTLMAIGFWVLLKTYIINSNAQQKYQFAKSGQKALQSFELKLDGILKQGNPLPKLEELRKNIETTVDTTHSADAWPFFNANEKYKMELEEKVKHYCDSYELCWIDVPDNDERVEV